MGQVSPFRQRSSALRANFWRMVLTGAVPYGRGPKYGSASNARRAPRSKHAGIAVGNLDGPAGIAKLEAPVLAIALQLAKMAMSRVTTDTDADSVIYKPLAAQQNGNSEARNPAIPQTMPRNRGQPQTQRLPNTPPPCERRIRLRFQQAAPERSSVSCPQTFSCSETNPQ